MTVPPDYSQYTPVPRVSPQPSLKLLGTRSRLFTGAEQGENQQEALSEEGPNRAVICFHCGQISVVPEQALSAQCKHCGEYMNLKDVTLTASSRRTLVCTQGDIVVESGASLSGMTLLCRQLTMDGWADGRIYCQGELRLNHSGSIDGIVQAHTLRVSKKNKVAFHRTVRLKSAVIEGEVTGNILCEGPVTLGPSGVVMGDITATSLELPLGSVHKGKFHVARNWNNS